jgi:large conductance mechanosensitive channel
MWQEFKAFAFKGNLIDVAVAFVLGVAFATLMTATVTDLITPIVAAVAGQPSFANLSFSINGSKFAYGHWFNALITFLITALVLFLLVRVVVRVQGLFDRDEPPPEPALRPCPFCFENINLKATRCSHCTADVQPA